MAEQNTPVENKKTDPGFEEITKLIKEDLESTHKILRTNITVKIVLLCAMVIYLSFLYSMIAKLDSDSVVYAASQKFLKDLPQIANNAKVQLKQNAPKFADDVEVSILQAIPDIRKSTQQKILDEALNIIPQFESQINSYMSDVIKKHKDDINTAMPNTTTAKKLDRLTMFITDDFKKNAIYISEQLRKDLSGDIKKLNKQFSKLQSGKNLTPKEMTERKLLGVWAKLMQIKMKDYTKDPHLL
jgi:hypothetical protein